MDAAFEVHMLTDEGKVNATLIGTAFNTLLEQLKGVVPEGRELAIVKTKLEEACMFAKKGMAKTNSI